MQLTNRKYWDQYYGSSITEKAEIIRICSQHDNLFDLVVASCHKRANSIIEIGAYPGRYLAYISAKYALKATALDFVTNTEKIEESFKSMSHVLEEIIQKDFLYYQPEKKYDLVFSNGFIEHFINYNEILDKHVDYLKRGGAMLIMIPNKRYLRKWYGLLVDNSNLRVHNLKCMKLEVFRDFARRNNLVVKYLSYYGGFAYRVHQKLNLPQRIFYKIIRVLSRKINPFLEIHPNAFYSGSIVGIFQKPYA